MRVSAATAMSTAVRLRGRADECQCRRCHQRYLAKLAPVHDVPPAWPVSLLTHLVLISRTEASGARQSNYIE
jgi:hypothetical protein